MKPEYTLTPSTLKSITQLFESEDCLTNIQRMETQGNAVVIPVENNNNNKTFVKLNSQCWQGGTTTVVTPSEAIPTIIELVETEPQIEDGLTHVDEIKEEIAKARKSTRVPKPKRKISSDWSEEEEQIMPKKKKKTCGRKPANAKVDEDLSPDELERVKIRRLRNKEAAARCRQKRVDLTNTLMKEVEMHEIKRKELEDEIKMLRQQKEDLEFCLNAHKNAKCNLNEQSFIKSEPVVVEEIETFYKKPRRPLTLAIPTSKVTEDVQIPIDTPSKVIPALTFDNVTTGLTPCAPVSLANIITPTLTTPTNCGSQQRSIEDFSDLITIPDLVSL